MAGKVSRVWLGVHRQSCIPVALKAYAKECLTPTHRQQISREISIHSKLNHPNILKLFAHFEDSNFFVVVLEYVDNGDLFFETQRCGGAIPESVVAGSNAQ